MLWKARLKPLHLVQRLPPPPPKFRILHVKVTYYNRSARARGAAGMGCGHRLLQDHVLMFGSGKFLARFDYREVKPYTV